MAIFPLGKSTAEQAWPKGVQDDYLLQGNTNHGPAPLLKVRREHVETMSLRKECVQFGTAPAAIT
jgi:hypothetical protein